MASSCTRPTLAQTATAICGGPTDEPRQTAARPAASAATAGHRGRPWTLRATARPGRTHQEAQGAAG
eukprot:3847738-Alexandrium_andersonii.AAC.1